METTKLTINSESGHLAATLFRPDSDTSRIAIVMHGFMSSQRFKLIRHITKLLINEGIAVLTFDFNGHGHSDGRFQDMTVLNELSDAKAVYQQVRNWEWVKEIYLMGHSQGGVVTGLLAGQLGTPAIKGIVLLAPAAVLHTDALEGHIMNATFDPQNIPPHVRVFFVKKIGQQYFQVAQQLNIYGDSCSYTGPVCIIHGKDDNIVPYSYSERYHNEYANSTLHLLEHEGHMLNHHTKTILTYIQEFVNR